MTFCEKCGAALASDMRFCGLSDLTRKIPSHRSSMLSNKDRYGEMNMKMPVRTIFVCVSQALDGKMPNDIKSGITPLIDITQGT